MPEFFGSDFQIDIQKRLIVRQEWLAECTTMANGGRIMNILDPGAIGWDRVRELVAEDGAIALTAMPIEGAIDQLQQEFGDGFDFPRWNIHLSDADRVLKHSVKVLAATGIADTWRLACLDKPGDAELAAIQSLNLATGVAPLPGPYIRGEAVPSFTSCLWTEDGQLAAVSNVTARYHPDSRFGHHVFNGSTSVSQEHRGGGLGKVVTAHVLIESQRALAWTHALAQVAPGNEPSRRMVEACGLARDETMATFGVIRLGETFTR